MFKLPTRPFTRIAAREKVDSSELTLTEKLIEVKRTAKVTKGGKRLSFRALVIVGDGRGHVGAGVGKAREVPTAIRKAGAQARKSLISVSMSESTIPHEIAAKFGAAHLLLKPAAAGTGVIAAGGIRAVLEAAGVKDVVTKSLGSSNPNSVVRATLTALANLRQPKEVVARRMPAPKAGKEVKG